MKTTCLHCGGCYRYQEVANAHTVFESTKEAIVFSSTDDDLGIEVCQVCHKPTFWQKIWHKTLQQITFFRPPMPRVLVYQKSAATA
ncbi:MAG: hypothetical protein ACK4GN_03680 [Runella sp.]